ncbi:MAG: hypothetical protein K9J16_13965 [Melioribacteraceae bacterium]|nr:hypothetical protein [Melioribacteraceae bacterium]MCF8355572.1 hypothetical protein [Melioribacteraceae bacterium]MCF8395049.1 hypothetical protein [Melioribacteraceae bacterium]MCF8420503.1 hypothetical protein [Melioribacteraceae bacterium]
MSEENGRLDNLQIINYLKDLDNRINRIEARLNLGSYSSPAVSAGEDAHADADSTSAEMNVGEYWFANLGILVLAIFFSFLLSKPYPGINQFLPTVFGLVVVGGMIGLSKVWADSFSNISRYLFGSGLFLLFVSMMRLFYFTPEPVVESSLVSGLLLLAVSATVIAISIYRNSMPLNSLGFTLLALTGLLIESPYLLFILLTFCSLGFVLLHHVKDFSKLPYLLYGIILVYLTHTIWMLNTPFFGKEIKLISDPSAHVFFMVIYMLIFGFGFLMKQTSEKEEELEISISFINTILSFLIFTIACVLTIKESLFINMVVFSAAALLLAIFYWLKTNSRFSTYIYTLFSFIALSIAIISYFSFPAAFNPLIWQSLVVIAFAIWFRSKSIIVSNFVIFLLILIAYLVTTKSFGFTTVSIGFIGLISARILNWQKDKLTLKTEALRNTYLAIAFIIIPFSLIKVLPAEYTGLALIGISSLYYLMSGLLNNFKYRWMAHFTLLGSLIYIMLFGLSDIDTVYQVITLFALALTLISVSIFYTKMRLKSSAGK